MQTFLIISGSILALIVFIWWLHGTIRQSLCCGTCGCNLVSEKTKKKMLARRAKKLMKKNSKCDSCPKHRP